MPDSNIGLMSHLMRRAAFGAGRDELDAYAAKGYEATVDGLLHPGEEQRISDFLVRRFHPEISGMMGALAQGENWLYRMATTSSPLQEKMGLFWHGIFPTGYAKVTHGKALSDQTRMFRRHAMGSFRTLLVELSKDPAMIIWLDNQDNHKEAINENFGRELLELFSMGVGNYTEDDVKECARAFTGWTVTNSIPRYPYGKYEAKFIYDSNDHDFGEKTFLGETGNWNGEDIINIVAKQAGTARFISRHLYNFFVSDEPQVPAWQNTPPGDPATIKSLEDEYFRTNYDIRSMLRVLFKSDAFKNSRFTKVKSPTETVVGTMRLVGDFSMPKPGMNAMSLNIRYMGQDLMNPPTVEGWHTGREWIDSGTLVERINFTADAVGNTSHPGIQSIIQRLVAQGPTITAEQLVDGCLDMLGAYVLADVTRNELLALAKADGDLRTGTPEFETRVGQMLQSIVATTEYLFA